jgi:phosphoglycerate dehydrogenase-like enzyme
MAQSRIGIMGRLGHFLLDDIERALRHLGHLVTRYKNPGVLDANTHIDALIAGSGFHYSREFMASSPYLRGIVSPVTCIEWIDVSAATDLGIVVANGPRRTPRVSQRLRSC